MKFAAPLIMLLGLSGCEDPPAQVSAPGSTTPRYERAESRSNLSKTTTPVRIGELGPNFAACNTLGTTRRLVGEGEGALIVRAAPFGTAEEIGRLGAGSRFFVCSRSIDQKWFGVVYEGSGAADASCQVAAPVPSRRNYAGPCHSGWVASAYVKVIANIQAGSGTMEAPEAEPGNASERES